MTLPMRRRWPLGWKHWGTSSDPETLLSAVNRHPTKDVEPVSAAPSPFVAATHQPAPLPEPEEALALVRRLLQVPMSLRRFTVTPAVAAGTHRVDAHLLNLLVGAGLPAAGRNGEQLFDGYDIGNAALHLGRTSVQRRAIRTWGAALRAGTVDRRARSLELFSTCPAPGHSGPCRYDVLQPGGTRRRVQVASEGEAELWAATLPPPLASPDLPDDLTDLLHELDCVEFFLLPEVIRWDHELMWRTGMGDCGVIADWLVGAGRHRGYQTRFSFGLLTAAPYSTPHCWAEFQVDGRWVAVDPVLVRAMTRWGGLDEDDFPAHVSIDPIVHRLSDRFTKLVSHGGIWSPVSARTTWVNPDREEQ